MISVSYMAVSEANHYPIAYKLTGFSSHQSLFPLVTAFDLSELNRCFDLTGPTLDSGDSYFKSPWSP